MHPQFLKVTAGLPAMPLPLLHETISLHHGLSWCMAHDLGISKPCSTVNSMQRTYTMWLMQLAEN